MEMRKILLSTILLLGIILSMNLVLGAMGITAPVEFGNYTSTMTVTCTSSLNTTDADGINGVQNYNVTIYINSSGGATGTDDASAGDPKISFLGTYFDVISNSTAYTNSFSASKSISSLTASLQSYNVSCMGDNGTNQQFSDGMPNITIYTSTPTCAYTINRDTVEYLNPIGIETDETSTKDALSDISYTWRLYDPTQNVNQESNSAEPTFSGTDFDELGEFVLEMNVSDRWENTATCTNKTVFVKGKDGEGVVSIISPTIPVKDYTLLWVLIGIGIIAIAIVTAFILIGVSKKR